MERVAQSRMPHKKALEIKCWIKQGSEIGRPLPTAEIYFAVRLETGLQDTA